MEHSTETHSDGVRLDSNHLLASHLSAGAAGVYVPHGAIIKLARRSSFWNEENEPTLDRLAVFVHEYVHYLHNFSTIAGIYEFVCQLRLARLVANTVDEAGRSHGQGALDPRAQQEIRNVRRWYTHLSGDTQLKLPPLIKVDAARIRFLHVEHSESETQFGPQTIRCHHVDAHIEVREAHWPPEHAVVRIGSHVLMEGLAWEVELLLYESQGEDTGSLESSVPSFPYKLPRVVFEGVSQRSLQSKDLAMLLLLALQSSDPGSTFVAMALAMRERPTDEEPISFVQRLVETMSVDFAKVSDAICRQTLPVEVAPFRTRGPAGRGLGRIADWSKAFLEVRKAQPFFELDLISRGIDRDALLALLKSYPPCPIIHQTGPGPRDYEFFIIKGVEPEATEVGEIGSAQGLLQFVSSHLQGERIVQTLDVSPAPCRFYGVCPLPLASESPDICRMRPWDAFQQSAKEQCWYGQGVFSLRAKKQGQ